MSAEKCDCGKIEHGRHHMDCPAFKPKSSADKCPVCGCDETWKAHNQTHYECGWSPNSYIKRPCSHAERLAIERAAEVERFIGLLGKVAEISHHGGLLCMNEHAALVAIRELTLESWCGVRKKPENQP